MDKSIGQEVGARAQEYAQENDVPYRKALLYMPPLQPSRVRKHLKSLPEYGVVDISIGGFIGVEDKNG